MARIKVATIGEIQEGDIKKVEVHGDSVALYKVNGEIFATTDTCTHEECSLYENHLIHGDTVECTCHGSQFNIKTGDVIMQPALDPLKTYQVFVEGEDVFVDA